MTCIARPDWAQDICKDSHTAADDKRAAAKQWKGCDDCGLAAGCCRHDAVFRVANIYKSGEKCVLCGLTCPA